jgi:hypothetical protein
MAFLLCRSALPAETVFGVTSTTSAFVMLDPADPMAAALDGYTVLKPMASAKLPLLDFYLEASFRCEKNAPRLDFSLDLMQCTIAPRDYLTIRLGRILYLPGFAQLFSPTNYFAALDLEELVQGRFDAAPLAADLVQLVLSGGDFSATLSVAPYPPFSRTFDPDSPWFPMNGIPRELHVTLFGDRVLKLTRITVAEAETAPRPFWDVSACAQVSGSLPFLDLSFLFYHGTDNSPLFRMGFDFPQGLLQNYSVILTPIDRTIDAVGIDALFTFAALAAWIDSSYTFSKTFMSKKLSVQTLSTETAMSPYLDLVAGARCELEGLRILFSVEYRDRWIVNETPDILPGLLSRLMTGTAVLRLFDDRLTVNASALWSVPDPWDIVTSGGSALAASSFCLIEGVLYSPLNEFEISLYVPYFLGGGDTELGQYADNHLVTASVTWKY